MALFRKWPISAERKTGYQFDFATQL